MTTPAMTGTVPVNGLAMYYEIHGTGQPLVLLHGAFSAIGTSFGQLLPNLPASQLAVLPGTSHVSILSRADLLLPIITPFLDAPMPEGA